MEYRYSERWLLERKSPGPQKHYKPRDQRNKECEDLFCEKYVIYESNRRANQNMKNVFIDWKKNYYQNDYPTQNIMQI